MFARWSAVAVLAIALGMPVTARASGSWRWPVDGDPVLAYGASYVSAAGTSCSHGGLDIGAPAGSTVRASCSGEVAFAGLVPAGEGQRAWAVTVLTSDGLRVTYLPLTGASVRKGQSVDAGQDLGSLAGTGDASGGVSHLHLGVKRGDTPLDPLGFLGARGAAVAPIASTGASAGSPGSPSAPAHAQASARARAAASSPAPGIVPVASGSAVSAPYASSVPVPGEAVQAALGALAGVPQISRIEQVAATPVLSLARMQADWATAQGTVVAWAIRLGLLLVACACVWPALRVARAAGAQAVPVAVRHEER